MKRKLFIALTIVYFSSCSNDKISENNIPNNLILERYTSFTYNNQGKLEYEKDYSSTDSLTSITTTFYNENGQMFKVVDWQPENGVIGLYLYDYDNVGKKISQRVYDKKGILSSKWQYLYDNKKRVVANILLVRRQSAGV